MKQGFYILILLLGSYGHAWAQADSTDRLLYKLQSNTITDAERKQLKAYGFDYQNGGQVMDESKHDFAGALILTNKAVTIFHALHDSLNEANNLKFKGYLLGRLGRIGEGKKEIQQAINLFGIKKAGWGVAVSQFDLARVFEFENKFDSALFYCNLAISYWKAKGDNGRIFLNQNMLIHLLTKLNRLPGAGVLQSESTKMAENPVHHWQGLLDLYVVSYNLFRVAQEDSLATHYQQLYAAKLAALKAEGITARSYFNEIK